MARPTRRHGRACVGSRARILTFGLTELFLEPGCRMRNANERKALRSLPGIKLIGL